MSAAPVPPSSPRPSPSPRREPVRDPARDPGRAHEQGDESAAASLSLADALGRMRWTVEPGSFALAGFAAAPGPEDLGCLHLPPAQVVREGGETTVLARQAFVEELLARHPGARCERELAWIRFELPMAWELVGFLARVTGVLAEAGVPLGAVCGYSRDHLFVAEAYLPAARAALEALMGPETPRAT